MGDAYIKVQKNCARTNNSTQVIFRVGFSEVDLLVYEINLSLKVQK